MNIRSNPLVLGMTLVAAGAMLVAGCNRTPPAPPALAPVTSAQPVTPTTTVGTDIDDTVITGKVKSALLGDQDIKGLEIKVETRKGTVQLSGFVANQAQADRAISVARTVEGVKGTENGMSLKDGKTSVGNKIDDGIVTAKVKSAFLSDASIKGIDIAVVTRKGEVQLSGFVDNQAQIDRALAVTRRVEGVQGVANEMSIKK